MIAQAPAAAATRMDRDLKVLVRFVEIYCRDLHRPAQPAPLPERVAEQVAGLIGRQACVCPDCAKLLTHALVKRSHCPMDPKPQCKHCPNHCYAPKYRQQIREVMKHSGRKLVLRGRLDYLLHLLF